MEETIVRINPDGTAFFLQNDDYDFEDLGKLKHERASNVVFQDDIQRWVVFVNLPTGVEVLNETFKKRGDAIRAEIAFLNDQLLDGSITPDDIF